MAKKGFTIVEMVMAFVLASTVIFFLFNIVFLLKDSYIETTKSSTLYSEQAILTQTINHDLYTIGVDEIVINSTTTAKPISVTFKLKNDEEKLLEVTKGSTNKIKYDNYLYPLEESEDYEFENITSFDTNLKVCRRDNIFVVNIPIHSKRVEDINFGVKIIYPLENVTVTGTLSTCR